MQGLITQNQTDIATNASAIAAEAVTRASQDASIRAEFAAVDTALQTQIDGKVSKSGDTMSGVLNMGNNKIVDVANGVNTKDAVNKGQLDAGLGYTAHLTVYYGRPNRRFKPILHRRTFTRCILCHRRRR